MAFLIVAVMLAGNAAATAPYLSHAAVHGNGYATAEWRASETLGWLATNRAGQTFVVEAMVSNPDAVLSEESITDLVALAGDAFGLVG